MVMHRAAFALNTFSSLSSISLFMFEHNTETVADLSSHIRCYRITNALCLMVSAKEKCKYKPSTIHISYTDMTCLECVSAQYDLFFIIIWNPIIPRAWCWEVRVCFMLPISGMMQQSAKYSGIFTVCDFNSSILALKAKRKPCCIQQRPVVALSKAFIACTGRHPGWRLKIVIPGCVFQCILGA